MNKFFKIICVALLSLISSGAFAQDSAAIKERPKVGLVLSGGGAKGAAHIGVLKYIEEAGIPILFHSTICLPHSCVLPPIEQDFICIQQRGNSQIGYKDKAFQETLPDRNVQLWAFKY